MIVGNQQWQRSFVAGTVVRWKVGPRCNASSIRCSTAPKQVVPAWNTSSGCPPPARAAAPTDGPRTASAFTHRYRTHRVQPFDTPTLTVWVSPATGVAAPPGAPSYAADPLTEHITRR